MKSLKIKKNLLICCLFLWVPIANLMAKQSPAQIIKGQVIDRYIRHPLSGATITLLTAGAIQTITDSSGNFKMLHIPIGRQNIRIEYIGFKSITLSNLLVESGKELDLAIEMEELVSTDTEVVVRNSVNKTRALNPYAMVSSRMFSVEETRRFAAGLNDPARIATAFAGVTGNGDGNSL
ncbi:MAG: hypothetical protein RLZZ28_392, partial [Bacteroidota bacterium]